MKPRFKSAEAVERFQKITMLMQAARTQMGYLEKLTHGDHRTSEMRHLRKLSDLLEDKIQEHVADIANAFEKEPA